MPISIYPATIDDADQLFNWRNDPQTIQQSTSNKVIGKDEHMSWLKQKLDSQDTLILMGHNDESDKQIGMVRFDAHDEHFWIISINMAPDWRGKNLSSLLLEAAMTYFGKIHTAILTAYVKADNKASRKCFERCGFALYEEHEDELTYMNKVLVINEIEAVRSRNNVNWMNLMRLAFRVAPHEAEEIFKNVNKDDGTIATLLNILTSKMIK
jgi:RimJ/RimL family protein N-acetyltransferase